MSARYALPTPAEKTSVHRGSSGAHQADWSQGRPVSADRGASHTGAGREGGEHFELSGVGKGRGIEKSGASGAEAGRAVPFLQVLKAGPRFPDSWSRSRPFRHGHVGAQRQDALTTATMCASSQGREFFVDRMCAICWPARLARLRVIAQCLSRAQVATQPSSCGEHKQHTC
jgi:hypothetical protein